MTQLILRPATESDKALLLSWRNDPATRANSRRQHVLNWEELAVPPRGIIREIFVGTVGGEPVGSIRFDYSDTECEVSWVVAPEHRGRGLGLELLRRAVEIARVPNLVAEIKPGNWASRCIAKAAGFVFVHQDGDLMTWRMNRETKP
jgi:RimJ/RimL family protein N-acetyltransferase